MPRSRPGRLFWGSPCSPRPCCVCHNPQVRITSVNKVRNYISYAVALLEEKGHSSVVLKAMGQAINKAVVVGECNIRAAACPTHAQLGTPWQLDPDSSSTGPVTPALLSSPSASQRLSACAIPPPLHTHTRTHTHS